MENKGWIWKDKNSLFAMRIVRLAPFLQQEKKEPVLNKQVLKSGTSVGALIREDDYAQSAAGYSNKLRISLKEANETAFWIALLQDTDYMDDNLDNSLFMDCDEIISMPAAIMKTVKNKKLSTHNS